jgi:hypothetical protein
MSSGCGLPEPSVRSRAGAALTGRITAIHKASKETYGAPLMSVVDVKHELILSADLIAVGGFVWRPFERTAMGR